MTHKPATGPEAFEQMRKSRLCWERALQGARELDAGQVVRWSDYLKEVEERERREQEAEGHADPPTDSERRDC